MEKYNTLQSIHIQQKSKFGSDSVEYFKTPKEWRSWLESNHDQQDEYWFVYCKDPSKPSVTYQESLEEALCFGWVDGKIQRIDETFYHRRFTPRKEKSRWSPSNIKTAKRLIKEGRMTQAGLDAVQRAKEQGLWGAKTVDSDNIPDQLEQLLKTKPEAWEFFTGLSDGYKRAFIRYVMEAKREGTKEKRRNTVLEMCINKEKPTM